MKYRCSAAVATLALALAAALPAFAQDECATAIPALDGANVIDTTLLTTSTDTYTDAQCAATFLGDMAQDVWYAYTPAAAGFITINTCDAGGFDTDVVVYDGTCAALNQIGCNGDGTGLAGCQDFYSYLVGLPVSGATPYIFRIGGWDPTEFGPLTWTLTFVPAAPTEAGSCNDGIDNDSDALVDCEDPDCAGLDPACFELGNCADGVDNDLDGQVDCADAECVGNIACDESANCTDGADNDQDGFLDCQDPDCQGIVASGCEDCANGVDDDADGLTDCADIPDCCGVAGCPAPPTNDSCANALVVAPGNTTLSSECATGANATVDPNAATQCNTSTQIGADLWFSYTPGASGDVVIDFCASDYDTSVAVYEGGCSGLEIDCNSDCHTGGACTNFASFAAFPVVAGVEYSIRVGGWDSGTGNISMDLSFHPTGPEVCDNFVDDDDDGNLDCLDTDCDADPACTGALCPPTSGGVLSQNTDPNLLTGGNSVACATAAPQVTVFNEYWRSYLMPAAGQIYGVRLGVEISNPGCGQSTYPITVNIFNDPTPPNPAPRADHVLLGSGAADLGNLTLEFTCIPLAAPVAVAANQRIVVQVVAEDGFDSGGSVFFIGSNAAGQSNPTYLSSTGCGIAEPTSVAAIGFPNMQAVIDLVMGTALPETNCTDTLDDDLDGAIDCADSDCAADPACQTGGPEFRRGDCNTDGLFNIADPISTLGFLFPSGPPPVLNCQDSCDANDDGLLNIADPIAKLGVLFPSGPPPVLPAPFPACGEDPTTDTLDCTTYASCP